MWPKKTLKKTKKKQTTVST